jgi:hypothetical protein
MLCVGPVRDPLDRNKVTGRGEAQPDQGAGERGTISC